jgi:hypothetical protein
MKGGGGYLYIGLGTVRGAVFHPFWTCPTPLRVGENSPVKSDFIGKFGGCGFGWSGEDWVFRARRVELSGSFVIKSLITTESNIGKNILGTII